MLWGCFERLDGFPDDAGTEVAVCYALRAIEVDAAFVPSTTSHCAPVAPQRVPHILQIPLLPTLTLVIIRFAKMFGRIQGKHK
jgi:hypothetical protein